MSAEHRQETPQQEWVKSFVPKEAIPGVLEVFANHEALLSQFHVGEPSFLAFGHNLQHESLEGEVARQEQRLQKEPQNIAVQLRYAAALNDLNAHNQKVDDLRLAVPGYGVAYDETDELSYEIGDVFKRMPYRILCNDVLRECSKLSPGLVSGLFCCVPLHKIRYGIEHQGCSGFIEKGLNMKDRIRKRI